MEKPTANITVLCNPPKGYRGDVRIIIGLNDESIGEGRPNEILSLFVPSGIRDMMVLVTNGSVNTLSGTTRINIIDGQAFRIKYSLFTKKATLVLDV